MSTNFLRVKEFNTVFQHPVANSPQKNIFSRTPKIVKLRNNLIIEEVSELLKAFNDRDIIETIDALSDILYVAYGLLVVYGIDGDVYYKKAIQNKIDNLNSMGDETIIIDDDCKTNYQQTSCLCLRFFSDVITNPTNFFSKITELKSFEIAIVSYIKQLEDELSKLTDATDNERFDDTIDITIEIIYFTYVIGILIGVDLDRSVKLVHESNMSKLCNSKKEAEQTVEWYKKNESRYDSPTFRKDETNNVYIVYNESSGKILKNINYKPVNLSCFIEK